MLQKFSVEGDYSPQDFRADDTLSNVVTFTEACEIAHVHPNTLRRYIRSDEQRLKFRIASGNQVLIYLPSMWLIWPLRKPKGY